MTGADTASVHVHSHLPPPVYISRSDESEELTKGGGGEEGEQMSVQTGRRESVNETERSDELAGWINEEEEESEHRTAGFNWQPLALA